MKTLSDYFQELDSVPNILDSLDNETLAAMARSLLEKTGLWGTRGHVTLSASDIDDLMPLLHTLLRRDDESLKYARVLIKHLYNNGVITENDVPLIYQYMTAPRTGKDLKQVIYKFIASKNLQKSLKYALIDYALDEIKRGSQPLNPENAKYVIMGILEGAQDAKRPLHYDTLKVFLSAYKNLLQQSDMPDKQQYFTDIFNSILDFASNEALIKVYKRGRAEPDKPVLTWDLFWKDIINNFWGELDFRTRYRLTDMFLNSDYLQEVLELQPFIERIKNDTQGFVESLFDTAPDKGAIISVVKLLNRASLGSTIDEMRDLVRALCHKNSYDFREMLHVLYRKGVNLLSKDEYIEYVSATFSNIPNKIQEIANIVPHEKLVEFITKDIKTLIRNGAKTKLAQYFDILTGYNESLPNEIASDENAVKMFMQTILTETPPDLLEGVLADSNSDIELIFEPLYRAYVLIDKVGSVFPLIEEEEKRKQILATKILTSVEKSFNDYCEWEGFDTRLAYYKVLYKRMPELEEVLKPKFELLDDVARFDTYMNDKEAFEELDNLTEKLGNMFDISPVDYSGDDVVNGFVSELIEAVAQTKEHNIVIVEVNGCYCDD